MKIVHLIGYFQPEFGYKEYYIARNQVKLGHEVHVIASDKVFPFPDYATMAKEVGAPPTRYRGEGNSVVDGVQVHRLKSLFETKDFIVIRGVKELLGAIRPDIVHAHAPSQGSTVLGALYKDKFNYFLIGDDQALIDTAHPKPYPSLQGRLRYELFQKYLRGYYLKKADVVFCPNNASKKYLEENFNLANKVKVVPIGFDSDFYYFDKKVRVEVRSRFKVDEGDFVILISGRLNPEKDFDQVIKLSADLLRKTNTKILIVGDGRAKERLVDLVEQLKLPDKVFFAGFVSEKLLFKYYSAADLAIWLKQPSVGISNAIGCSLPVLLPQTEIFSHYTNEGFGESFKPGDKNDFKRKLSQLVTDENHYQKIKQEIETKKNRLDYKNLAQVDIEEYEKSKTRNKS
ncbi:MAG TPA: glycosyltransferase [Candidatus Nanoarchaeia archaeon]|nr:D-inositol-3-phosphate glycosyltransferase [uncultured archaeon]